MIVLCSVGILASGCSKSHKPDSLTLQGTWSGSEVGVNTQGSLSLIIEGTNYEFHGANSNDWEKGTFSLREDTTPKQIEAIITECSAPQYVGKTIHGVYKIEDDTFTYTVNEPGNPAVPPSFDTQGASKYAFTQKQ